MRPFLCLWIVGDGQFWECWSWATIGKVENLPYIFYRGFLVGEGQVYWCSYGDDLSDRIEGGDKAILDVDYLLIDTLFLDESGVDLYDI